MPLRSRSLVSVALLLVLALSSSCNPNPQPEALTPIPTLAPAATLTLVTELQELPAAGGEAAPTASGETPSSPEPAGGDPASGAAVFAANCVGCHGENAQGGAVGPTLVSAQMAAKEDDYYRETLRNGIQGTAMPAWGGRLSAKEIEDVIAFLRSQQ
jgi:mono/diheme cytochrome c family protein